MAQYRTDNQEFTSSGGTLFETQMLATKNGQVIDESNPLPVTLAVNVALNDLTDVDTAGVTDGSIIVYDETSEEWIIGSQSSGGLSDDGATTDITSDTISVIDLPNTDIGPIQSLQFDTDYVADPPYPNGTIRWNQSDNTLNINHDGGVVQQVGQEFFYFVRNETGTTIPNGTVVKFAGASEEDGEPRLLIDEFLADGTDPSLYCLGITTQTCENNQPCRVAVDGKVRGIDTTGSPYGETWAVGDLLYASPSVSGGLTKFKPTAPDNVLPIAAVVKTDATEGQLQVRATIEQDLSYGRFVRLTNFTFADADTAYALDYDATDISNGVEVVNGTELEVNQSGFYQIDVNLQADATSNGFSSAVLYTWVRINGTDVEHTARRQGIVGSAPSTTFSFNLALSFEAGDKLEVMLAANETNLVLDAADATSFAPSAASALVSVTQVQL